jgi:3-hydroxyisobutyrate dehydrogenase
MNGQTKQTVAVLGAGGTMGEAMARNVLAAGMPVRAWNRSREKTEALGADGAEICSTPAEAAEGAEVLLTILSDRDAVWDTAGGGDGALGAAPDGALWLQMSTIGIEGTERCAEMARDAGVGFVDAPVLGTKQPAQKGELTVVASGPPEARERCGPVFDAVGRETVWAGEAGAGTRLKLVVNAWLVSLVEGLAETIAFAEGIGTDPGLFLETIGGGPLDSDYAQLKGKSMIERSFDPAFKLSLAAKDAGLVAEAAERYGLDVPVLDAIRRRLSEGAENHGDEDMAATFRTSAPPSA